MNTPTIRINWTCPDCHHPNQPLLDPLAIVPGIVHLTCDLCEGKSAHYLVSDGYITPLDQKPSPPTPLSACLTSAPDDLTLATTIMQGLLASGHYTNEDQPVVRFVDNGPDWQAKRYPSRIQSRAAIDAVSLLHELKRELQKHKPA